MIDPSLTGRCVLVTGASRGIGAAIAAELARHGARLALLSRDEAELGHVADRIAATAPRPVCIVCDVSDPEQVARSVPRAIERMQGLYGVVNNAGINRPMRPFLAVSRAEFREVLETNFFGATEIVRAALPYLIDHSEGSIVNIASMAGKMGVPNWAAYCSSKHALLGFTKVIAREVALSGVTCNAICPGFVDTNMVSREELEQWAAELGTSRRALIKEVILKQAPQYRYVAAESIATMTAYLLSNRALDITGQAINVSCGIGDY
jgi:3-hydroxybutyrate dehydrogenase